MTRETPKILVVDDVPQNVRLLEMNLKSEGYNVISAYNGEEALVKVYSEQPELILLDIMMPVMDGHEVCRSIRQDKNISWIPIIMLTAFESGIEKKIESLNAGADDFLKKPFDRYELLARVRSLLRIKQLHDSLAMANQRLEEELVLAKEVQQALLPHDYPKIADLGFSHRYIPILAVGGDFFDIHQLSSSSASIFLCDVMGHGPQAAMITGIIKILLNQLSPNASGPDDLLYQMNDRFHSLISGSGLPIFITAFSLTIDVANNTIKYSNAGHPTPFIIRNHRNLLDELASNPGPALGMIPDAIYETYEQTIEIDDMVFLFTDGLLELTNSEYNQFGAAEIKTAIVNNMHLSPQNFVESIVSAALAFSEGLYIEDDITLLAFSYQHRNDSS